MSLDNFKKPIELAREVIDERYIAYKMDSNVQEGNMRKAVGLGTCHCCDYFLLEDRSIILIEETSLPNLDDATENAEIKFPQLRRFDAKLGGRYRMPQRLQAVGEKILAACGAPAPDMY